MTRDSDRVITEARRVRDDNRAGGRHRRELGRSIGQESRALKRVHLTKKVQRAVFALIALWIGSMAIGVAVDGIGVVGVMALSVISLLLLYALIAFPKLKTPTRPDLAKSTDARALVGKTELWLEAQRPALPAPAADMVGKIGVQLDSLGLQLDGIDADHPAAREVRSLVGETLPEMVDSYRRIPAHLRTEQRAGATPDQQLTSGLGKISDEIDRVTRQLAEGSLDDLAVKTRYLDYKYGEDGADAGLGAPALTHAPPAPKDPA
jgi:hypothetical protein